MNTKKKIGIVSAGVICFVGMVSVIQSASADVDSGSMLESWFAKKEQEAIHSMEISISAEKEVLLQTLRAELKQELQSASNELDSYQQSQTNESIQALREYAANLSQSISIDNSEEKAAIDQSINAIVEDAIARLNGVPVPAEPAEEVPTETVEVEDELVKEEEQLEPPTPPATEDTASDEANHSEGIDDIPPGEPIDILAPPDVVIEDETIVEEETPVEEGPSEGAIDTVDESQNETAVE